MREREARIAELMYEQGNHAKQIPQLESALDDQRKTQRRLRSRTPASGQVARRAERPTRARARNERPTDRRAAGSDRAAATHRRTRSRRETPRRRDRRRERRLAASRFECATARTTIAHLQAQLGKGERGAERLLAKRRSLPERLSDPRSARYSSRMTNEPRNVLLITADQWRADCLSSRGHPCVATPHLDALARDGVAFTRHYCQAVPCGPSRASLHTGLYLMNHRSATNGTPLDRRHDNWAQIVRGAGYDPVLFGYTDTSPDPRDYPRGSSGADDLRRGAAGPAHRNVADDGRHHVVGAVVARARRHRFRRDRSTCTTRKRTSSSSRTAVRNPRRCGCAREHHDTFFMTDQVIDYLTQRREPWCVHLSLLRPHPPWIAPAPYHARYPPDDAAGIRPRAVRADRRRAASVARVSAVGQAQSRAGVRGEAAAVQGVVLRPDERGRRQPRPPDRTSEGDAVNTTTR